MVMYANEVERKEKIIKRKGHLEKPESGIGNEWEPKKEQ